MKTLKTIKTNFSNKIEFNQYDFLSDDCIVVRDHDCQLERTCKIGEKCLLDLDNPKGEILKSFEQLFAAWENNKVWF